MKKISSILPAVAAAILVWTGCSSIHTSIEIDAPAGAVWETFADFTAYKEWNPFILKLDGEIQEGKTISIELRPAGKKPMSFSPKILRIEQGKTFEWQGRLLMPGIFTGRHRFELREAGKNRTVFIQSEEFSGILIPFFDFAPTVRGFEKMNAELKKRVERQR